MEKQNDKLRGMTGHDMTASLTETCSGCYSSMNQKSFSIYHLQILVFFKPPGFQT